MSGNGLLAAGAQQVGGDDERQVGQGNQMPGLAGLQAGKRCQGQKPEYVDQAVYKCDPCVAVPMPAEALVGVAAMRIAHTLAAEQAAQQRDGCIGDEEGTQDHPAGNGYAVACADIGLTGQLGLAQPGQVAGDVQSGHGQDGKAQEEAAGIAHEDAGRRPQTRSARPRCGIR